MANKDREKSACWQHGLKKIFSCLAFWSLRKCSGMSQLSKAIGHWWPWLSHFLLSVHFPVSLFQNRQGDLGILTDATISCFRHAGFHWLSAWQRGKHLGRKKTNKQHPFLDNLLIMLQRLACCPYNRYISFPKATMPFIDSLSDLKWVSKVGACLHFPLVLLFNVANTKTRQEFHQNFSKHNPVQNHLSTV